MSSVTVLCPNAHRVKVSTSPNMSLQAVLETACTKKGFDSAVHVLEHHNKRIDLSSTVRFSGIPNNASLEMVKLTEEQMALMNTKQEVSVCLQTPSGERLVETFPSTASLGLVVGRWSDKLGEPGIGEKPVVVYMRREVVGQEELNTTSLKTLGLTQGKGLFRFFYKKPEVLKSQANVYDMKIDKPSPPPEVRHIPMRLEPEPHKVAEDDTASVQREDNATTISHPDDPSLAKTGQEPNQPDQPVASTSQGREPPAPVSCVETGAAPPLPDSTQPTPDPVINHVGPHGAIVFSALEESAQYQDLDDEFFDLSLDEVKILYKDLRQEVKKMGEGELLLTKEMREAQKKVDSKPKTEPTRKMSDEKPATGDATLRKPSNTENKTNNKDPVVNFIPIKVEHSRPESPMPKANSRAPSQEPGVRPGKSPTPARNTPQPEQHQVPKDPKIAKLDKIKEEVDILLDKIENFQGTKKDKEYLYLDEMLTRHLIALDGIEPEGKTEIRQMRKESIKSVNRCLSLLDHKVTEGNAQENNQILSDLAAKTENLEIGNSDSSSQKS
eukprot:GFUD01134497.1.p1 GENE.GFUD01134497.1~~GFUD01134497.1.p1  ORF type:complete len:555 (+),score=173.63 GFUD01134497.1:54-1718(+)